MERQRFLINSLKYQIVDRWFLYVNIHQVAKKPKDFQKPNNDNNHNHNIQDIFYLMIHGNIRIDNPQKNTYNDNYE